MSTEIAQVVLSQIPDIVIPLKELTGLNLPDVNIGDLRNLKIPPYLHIPSNVQLPGGIQIPNLQIPLKLPAPGDVSDPAILPPADQQPGAIVKELSRDTPFSMVALTSETLASAESKVRALQADGTWGQWVSPDMIDTRRTDKTASDGKVATEPVYVGLTKAIQILTPHRRVPHRAGAPAPEAIPAPAPAPEAPAPAPRPPQTGPHRSATPPPPSTRRCVSSRHARAPTTSPPCSSNRAAAPATRPSATSRARSTAAVPRSSAASSGAPTSPSAARTPTTTTSSAVPPCTTPRAANDYSKAESAEIVRAIYAYHAQTLGWCDIGYNALVDKYGQIFEGRAGGLDRPVQGAHAGGFNENTTGVAMMGDFSSEDPPQATLDAVGKFLGWKLGKAGLDPLGETTMYSEGTEFTPYAEGEAVDLPVIFAHRDVGNTSCPGDAAYSHMDEIRQIAAANLGGRQRLASPRTHPRVRLRHRPAVRHGRQRQPRRRYPGPGQRTAAAHRPVAGRAEVGRGRRRHRPARPGPHRTAAGQGRQLGRAVRQRRHLHLAQRRRVGGPRSDLQDLAEPRRRQRRTGPADQ